MGCVLLDTPFFLSYFLPDYQNNSVMSIHNEQSEAFMTKSIRVMAFVGLTIAFLIIGKPILLPLITAIFLAFLVLPMVQKLNKCCLPNWLSVLLGVISVCASVMAVISFFWWQAMSFVDDLPALKASLYDKQKDLLEFIRANFSISYSEQQRWLVEKKSEFWNNSLQNVGAFFTATGSALSSMVLIPLFMFFLLLYRDKFRQFMELINPQKQNDIVNIMRSIGSVSKSYIRGMGIVIVLLSVLNSIGFMLLGLEYAILLGMLAALLNIIPYVGVLIGSLLPITMALITKDSLFYAIGALGVCVVVQFLENNFITPKIVGSSVNINPLASIIAMLAGGLVWGLPGLILAIPMAGSMKVLFDNVDALKPLGFLIGEEQDATLLKRLRAGKLMNFRWNDYSSPNQDL